MIGIKQAVIAGLGVSAVAGGSYGTYYLLQDKTIEDRLNREGFSLIKSTKGYQVAFKELKENENFIKDIESYGSEITKESTFNVGGVTLEKWCSAKIKESLSTKDVDALIKKVKDYCQDRPLTIGTKLKKNLLTKGWDTKLASLKSPSTDGDLLTDLKTVNDKLKSLEEGTDNKVLDAFSKWCKDNYAKDLTEDKDNKIYEKVDKRCTE